MYQRKRGRESVNRAGGRKDPPQECDRLKRKVDWSNGWKKGRRKNSRAPTLGRKLMPQDSLDKEKLSGSILSTKRGLERTLNPKPATLVQRQKLNRDRNCSRH